MTTLYTNPTTLNEIEAQTAIVEKHWQPETAKFSFSFIFEPEAVANRKAVEAFNERKMFCRNCVRAYRAGMMNASEMDSAVKYGMCQGHIETAEIESALEYYEQLDDSEPAIIGYSDEF